MKNKVLIVVDADYYIFATACKHADLTPAIEELDKVLSDLQIEVMDALDIVDIRGNTSTVLALSCQRENGFRRKILPTYKANRDGTEKPPIMAGLVAYCRENYDCIESPELEADDILGILGSCPSNKYNVCMVSIDKDLRSIPGLLYNSNKQCLTRTDDKLADLMFYTQCLMGDSTDGYTGLPGCGPKRAADILESGVSWGKVWQEYRDKENKVLSYIEDHEQDIEYKGLRSFALQQARVARILRWDEWTKEGGPVLYLPPGFTKDDE